MAGAKTPLSMWQGRGLSILGGATRVGCERSVCPLPHVKQKLKKAWRTWSLKTLHAHEVLHKLLDIFQSWLNVLVKRCLRAENVLLG